MRRPTKKELWQIAQNLKGLKGDLEALGKTDAELQEDGVSLFDVIGTFGVNVEVLSRIHQRLKEEAAHEQP